MRSTRLALMVVSQTNRVEPVGTLKFLPTVPTGITVNSS